MSVKMEKDGKYMISRTLLAGIYASVICGLIMIPFFHFSYGKSDGNSGAKEIYSMIKDIIPSDPISPFLNGNMLQICLIAVLTGSVIIMLGNRVDQIREEGLSFVHDRSYYCVIHGSLWNIP